MSEPQLPKRYADPERLGEGGGGEVWAVRDRHTGVRYALKMLSPGASEREMAALVREAVSLSGLEGLGVPRVMRFGRLPESGRPYLVRELVEGRSLERVIEDGQIELAIGALVRAADQVTQLHRAGLLHGDIKPANIIVSDDGRATLVDLGLAAPWRETGTPAEGLTPKYAAPELLEGRPLTVRAEVYALGVTISDILAVDSSELGPQVRRELFEVSARATSPQPEQRHPSADELATALRRAALLGPSSAGSEQQLWPIVGVDSVSGQLSKKVNRLGRSRRLLVDGPSGSGRSALLRRLAWSLGVEGRPVVWLDESMVADSVAVAAELNEYDAKAGVFVLVDDADRLAEESIVQLGELSARGARLVLVGETPLARDAARFPVPPLDRHSACELVRRVIPSLTDRLLDHVVVGSGGRPGALRGLVDTLATQPVASVADIDRALSDAPSSREPAPSDAFERAVFYLDRGRFDDARVAIDQVSDPDLLAFETLRARLELGLGDATSALSRLKAVEVVAGARAKTEAGRLWMLYVGRAYVSTGDYSKAIPVLDRIAGDSGALGAEALAFRGLGLAYLGRTEESLRDLDGAVERARVAAAARVEAVALVAQGLVLQREDRIGQAREAYEACLVAGARAGDAGVLATAQLNLAGLLKVSGDVAGAIEHFEAAVDMGRRSGRRSTQRNALLNLANTDLYLGRLARARESIEQLLLQRDQLPPVLNAQLSGLQAELAARDGDVEQASRCFEACAASYEALGRGVDAAEARLERVLVASRVERPDLGELENQLELARAELGEGGAHRPLALLARGRAAWVGGSEIEARRILEEALEAARESGQKEWEWRALEARAEVATASGQPTTARRNREDALAILEEIGARLPRDLREVYWNDPRRRDLRSRVRQETEGMAATEHAAFQPARVFTRGGSDVTRSAISGLTVTPLEQRLAQLLEINSELARESDLEKLVQTIVGHAIDISGAERGYLILKEQDGSLTVHASRTRAGDRTHAEFSKSIAQNVIDTGQPMVTRSALTDDRLSGYQSVHQLSLQAVACVPIFGPNSDAVGSLYVETRHRSGEHFERELPTIQAFGDQAAIALETARLLAENKRRSDELERTNAKLKEAQGRLEELLQVRTKRLELTRRRLRDARDTLFGHFGYLGLVGTSRSMRAVYSLIDRVKDTDVPVLITGESGTGKEVVAKAIHQASQRSKKPFLGVNCGAIPAQLLESELFGHEKGAFTGADQSRKGLFREGEEGTLLLDEIGEMPQKMQASLLRVLQERKVRAVGGAAEQSVNVRVICATNRDLQAMVEDGDFREDLYYRIHVVELRLPALRERIEDVPQLVDHFLGLFSARYKRDRKTVSRDAMRRLKGYHWPGNVRQLEHVLLNAWVLSDSEDLQVDDFDIPDGRAAGLGPMLPSSSSHPGADSSRPSSSSRPPRSRTSSQSRPSGSARPGSGRSARTETSTQTSPRSTLSQHRLDERERILQALQACNWNRVKAAELSGIPRRTFYRRLRQYGIQ